MYNLFDIDTVIKSLEWVRVRPSFAILYVALLCVPGSCTNWMSLGIVDGASLPIVMAD